MQFSHIFRHDWFTVNTHTYKDSNPFRNKSIKFFLFIEWQGFYVFRTLLSFNKAAKWTVGYFRNTQFHCFLLVFIVFICLVVWVVVRVYIWNNKTHSSTILLLDQDRLFYFNFSQIFYLYLYTYTNITHTHKINK